MGKWREEKCQKKCHVLFEWPLIICKSFFFLRSFSFHSFLSSLNLFLFIPLFFLGEKMFKLNNVMKMFCSFIFLIFYTLFFSFSVSDKVYTKWLPLLTVINVLEAILSNKFRFGFWPFTKIVRQEIVVTNWKFFQLNLCLKNDKAWL